MDQSLQKQSSSCIELGRELLFLLLCPREQARVCINVQQQLKAATDSCSFLKGENVQILAGTLVLVPVKMSLGRPTYALRLVQDVQFGSEGFWIELLGGGRVSIQELSNHHVKDLQLNDLEAVLCELAHWWHSKAFPPMTKVHVTEALQRM
eukprot:757603-Pelagomonas_calceolata.AAC.1